MSKGCPTLAARRLTRREAFDAVDVAASLGDCSGDPMDVGRRKLRPEHGDDLARRAWRRRGIDDVKVDLKIMLPSIQEHLLQDVLARWNVHHQAKRDHLPHHDLLDVLHSGTSAGEDVQKARDDARLVSAADIEQHSLCIRHACHASHAPGRRRPQFRTLNVRRPPGAIAYQFAAMYWVSQNS